MGMNDVIAILAFFLASSVLLNIFMFCRESKKSKSSDEKRNEALRLGNLLSQEEFTTRSLRTQLDSSQTEVGRLRTEMAVANEKFNQIRLLAETDEFIGECESIREGMRIAKRAVNKAVKSFDE